MPSVTDCEKGKRVIIGGASPHIHTLPKAFLETGVVIGINRWFKYAPCDYWICCDTGTFYRDFKEDINALDAVKFMRARNMQDPLERAVPDDAVDFWFDVEDDHVDRIEYAKVYEGTLKYRSTTAVCAVDLAIRMGASQVILWGVDLMGGQRFDASSMGGADYWEAHLQGVNELLRYFSEITPIYKTNRESPLDVPFFDPLAVWEE